MKSWWYRLGGIGALWVVAFLTSLRRPVIRTDEAWFLWVAARANSGTPLYRGVYYVTTPLAMWCMQVAVWLGGTTVAVERALASLCFAGSAAFLWAIAARLGFGRTSRLLVVAALFVYGSPVTHFASVYSMLAVTFALAALWGVLHAIERLETGTDPRSAVWGAGLLCGLAFATKPNTGLLAFGAVVVSVCSPDCSAVPRAGSRSRSSS